MYISLILFIFLQLPLMIFDIRHNFINTKAMINIFINISIPKHSSGLIDRNREFISTLGRLIWTPPKADLFLESGQCASLKNFRKNSYLEGGLILILGLFIFFRKYIKNYRDRNISLSGKMVFAIFAATFLFIQFYQRVYFEYYLFYFFPWFFLSLGVVLDHLISVNRLKSVVYYIIICYIFINFASLLTADNSYSYSDKLNTINFVKNNISGDYNLEAIGGCGIYGGYRYLFDKFIKPPKYSYMDTYFSWLYYQKYNTETSKNTVLLSLIDPRDNTGNIARQEEDKMRILTQHNIEGTAVFGNIKVFILADR